MKKPRPGGGVSGFACDDEAVLARAKIRGPRMGAFFRGDCLERDCARLRDHSQM